LEDKADRSTSENRKTDGKCKLFRTH
jgi:hypothetical protein